MFFLAVLCVFHCSREDLCEVSPQFASFVRKLGGKIPECGSILANAEKRVIQVMEYTKQDKDLMCDRYERVKNDRHGLKFLNFIRSALSLPAVKEANRYERTLTKSAAHILGTSHSAEDVENSDSPEKPLLDSSLCGPDTENSMKKLFMNTNSVTLGHRRWL